MPEGRRFAAAFKWTRPYLGPFLVVLVAVFVGLALYGSWSEVRGYDWRFNPAYLALSGVLIGLYYLQQWGGWRLVMRSFGDPLDRADSMHIWYSTILGRYVPGSVAMVAGRISLCRRRGIPASTTFASIVYENALILITALLITVVCVPFWPAFRHTEYTLFLAALVPVCLALLHPAVFGRLANRLLLKLGRPRLEATLSYGRVLALIPYYLMGWALLGLGFAALAASVARVGAGDLALLVGGYAFAWEVGFLSVVVPSGIGVKEGMLTAISALAFPLPVAVALAALSRLWQTLAELTAAGLAWAFARRRARKANPRGRPK
ncbi:lysylphosphatidylglycerol synthase domain-containing protein [Rubrobacter aplysinae]|uniref:lysylphosphatidylglycerol synthase domain-containing protein n=1 Tax=Rubrobacter aplysinae TaxID=909625 RepID=UPI001364BDC9|nr:lysylphosphatidylglycerol synthase domain-containing protein [Rubrobacter aplysinae]